MDEPPQKTRFDLAGALAVLKGRKTALIYMHDNPDPDALAAAMGLKWLLEYELGATVTLAHGGIVGRAQNRAMVDTLKVTLMPVEQIDPDAFEVIALVDSQPETGNNSLPVGHRIDIVIDHHPVRPGSARAAWCDIRPDFGATSTIVFEYLRTRGVPLDARLATAFFFALRTETRDLGREATDAERDAYLSLITQVDHGLLYRMSHPKVPCAHFAALDRALRSAQVFGDIVAVNLGTLRYPDLVAESQVLQFQGTACAEHRTQRGKESGQQDQHRINSIFSNRTGFPIGTVGWHRTFRSCLNDSHASDLQLGFLVLKRQGGKRYSGSSADFEKLSSIHGNLLLRTKE